MGFIVFESEGGRAIKYYRKEATAKSQVTRHNREVHDRQFKWRDDREWSYLSYSDYEGVLMGMDYPELKIWAFCRGGKIG